MDLRDLNDDQRTFSEDLTNYDKKSKETVNEQIDALTNTFNSFKDDVSKKVQDQICYTRRRGPIQKRMLEFIEKFETNFQEQYQRFTSLAKDWTDNLKNPETE